MSNESAHSKIEIVPPPDLIQFPLSPAQFEDIVGVPKSTLLRWEREGQIPNINQVQNGNRFGREISEGDFILLLLHMKSQTRTLVRRDQPTVELFKHPWLQSFDPTKPNTLATPTGYILRFQGNNVTPHAEQ